MAYKIPAFDVEVGVWNPGDSYGLDPPTFVVEGNLALGRRSPVLIIGSTFFRQLLLPKGTDIRDPLMANGSSVVEVPLGSGFVYLVEDTERVGLGFANEHLVAFLNPNPPKPNY